MTKQIETLATLFFTGGHDMTAPAFVRGVLRNRKRQIASTLADVGVVPQELRDLLDVEIGDHTKPSGAPVFAVINDGAWKARCECHGAEAVDPANPVFLCMSCWNAANGYQWRPVVMPDDRDAIEGALLLRPDKRTRNWEVGEAVVALVIENIEHGIGIEVTP